MPWWRRRPGRSLRADARRPAPRPERRPTGSRRSIRPIISCDTSNGRADPDPDPATTRSAGRPLGHPRRRSSRLRGSASGTCPSLRAGTANAEEHRLDLVGPQPGHRPVVMDLRQLVDDHGAQPERVGVQLRRGQCPPDRAGEDGVDGKCTQPRRRPPHLFPSLRRQRRRPSCPWRRLDPVPLRLPVTGEKDTSRPTPIPTPTPESLRPTSPASASSGGPAPGRRAWPSRVPLRRWRVRCTLRR